MVNPIPEFEIKKIGKWRWVEKCTRQGFVFTSVAERRLIAGEEKEKKTDPHPFSRTSQMLILKFELFFRLSFSPLSSADGLV